MDKSIRDLIIIVVVCLFVVSVKILSDYRCNRLETEAQKKLSLLCEIKKEKIEAYFKGLIEEIKNIAQNTKTSTAMKEFKAAFKALDENSKNRDLDKEKGILYLYYQDQFIRKLNFHLKEKLLVEDFIPQDSAGIILQNAYIAKNPHDANKKENLLNSHSAGEYDAVHQKYHPYFRDTLHKFKHYDIFLIDKENGSIYYTVFKEIDFANNLNKTELRESNLAHLISASSDAVDPRITDFDFYDPSYAIPASFIVVPINDAGNKIGFLAFQIPVDQINDIMTDDEKWAEDTLGKTGETYLVGSDMTMRSSSRMLIENKFAYIAMLEKSNANPMVIKNVREFNTTVLLQKVDTRSARAALKGESGVVKTISYEGIPVLSAYMSLKIQDLNWAVIAEQSIEEICRINYYLLFSILLGIIGILMLLFLAFFLYKRYYNRVKMK